MMTMLPPFSTRRVGQLLGSAADAAIEAVRIAFFLSPFLLSLPQVARAAEIVEYEETVEEAAETPSVARFGPFAVIDGQTVEMRGATDVDSPAQFRSMIARYPAIRTLRMIDCAGTLDDEANFAVARMIRARGIDTFVPKDGSIRSGGVELFVAGAHHRAEPGAEFGVHSWQDEDGNEAGSASSSDPIHAEYVNYYKAMGLPDQIAQEFYAFTNRTDFSNIHYMTQAELARFQLLN
jgi:hypothetical protein